MSSSSCDLGSPSALSDSPSDSASSFGTGFENTCETVTWPPPGLTQSSELIACDAEVLICKGASTSEGYVSVMRNDPHQYRCFAFAGTPEREKLECHGNSSSEGITEWMTLTLNDPPEKLRPWDTVEQPSMLLRFGTIPGTITLNQWVGSCNLNTQAPGSLSKSAIEPREIGLLSILERLSFVQCGLEDDVSGVHI